MFDLENLNPGQRFYWPGSDEKEWVDLRVASAADIKEIRKSIGVKERVEHVFNPQTRGMERVEYLDVPRDKQDAFVAAVNDFCITDWNLLQTDGTSIPCTLENKAILMQKSPKFSGWIAECLDYLRKADAEHAARAEKN